MALKTRSRFQGALARTQQVGQTAEDEYLTRARGFNAQSAVEQSAQGAWGNLLPQIQRAIEAQRGRTAGTGRLQGGYGEMDEDEVWTRGTSELTNRIAENSLQGASLDVRNTEGLGDFGSRQTGRYNDLLEGERERETAAAEAARARKASRFGAIGGLIGSAAGTILGPAGQAIGNKLGSYVTGKLG